MNADTPEFSQPLAYKYLEYMEALADELKAGMDAIGQNGLSAFEQSVAKQHEICLSLCRLTGQMSLERAMSWPQGALSRMPSASDFAVQRKIELAGESLRKLSTQYAALLRHTGESVRLFAGLCRSYTGHFQPPAAASALRTTWSYES